MSEEMLASEMLWVCGALLIFLAVSGWCFLALCVYGEARVQGTCSVQLGKHTPKPKQEGMRARPAPNHHHHHHPHN